MSAHEYLVRGAIALDKGALVLIDEARGMLIYVWQGEVWVTQEGERRDRVLSAGEWLRVERGGRTVVSALGASAIALTSPREKDFAQSIALVQPGTAQPQRLHQRHSALAAFVCAVRELFSWRPRPLALR